jgi:dipeptidyl aminopeptidase/acylaminoacyl peptidase
MVKEVNRQMMKRAVLLLLTMAAAFTAARGAALVRVQQKTSSARQASLFRPSPVLTRQDRLRDSNEEIYVMDSNGQNQTRLTFNPADDTNIAISPDGTKIVFESQGNSNREIFVMNRDGSNKMRLTKNPADDVDHDWGVATP